MKLYKAVEVAFLLDVSLFTLNNWYKFKRSNPDNEYAQMLPDPIQQTNRQTRYWTEDDLQKLIEFKSKIILGRNGFMKSISTVSNKQKEKTNETQKTIE